MLRLTTVAVAASASLVTHRVQAQACSAFPPLDARPFRAAVHAASHEYASELGVSVAAATHTLYGIVTAARLHDGELDATAFDLTLAAGSELAVGSSARITLCPLLALALSLGPYDLLLSNDDYHRISAAAGFGIAGSVIQHHRIVVRVAGSARLEYLHATREFTSPQPTSMSAGDWYLMGDLGLGATLDSRWTLRASFSIPAGLVKPGDPNTEFAVPFGRENGEPSLELSFGFLFGRRSSR